MRIKDIIAVVFLVILCLFLAYEAYTVVHWWEWIFIFAIIICLGLQILDYFRYRTMSAAEIAKTTRKKRSPRGKDHRRKTIKTTKQKRSNRRASDERRGIRPSVSEELSLSAKKANPESFLTSLHAMDAQEDSSPKDTPEETDSPVNDILEKTESAEEIMGEEPPQTGETDSE